MAARIPAPGTLLAGRYRVEEALGHGAIGMVFAAIDEKTGVDCAIKLLSSPELREDRARLVREARALMLVNHPHVVRVFDVAEDDDGAPFLVLERLVGEDLSSLAPLGAKLPAADVVDYAAQVCEALEAAHARGIIHRDIKLSNLFLARSGPRPTIKVLDFGVSKLGAADSQGSLTRGDGPLGSPQFISPEQLADPRAVDARADLWALGVVMYRLLAGRFPFDGATVVETFALVARGDRPALREVAPEVPPALASVVERCLERDPGRRWSSATALRAALRADAPVTSEDDPATTVNVAPSPAPRRPWLLFAGGLVLTLGAGLLLSTRSGIGPPSASPVRVEPSSEPAAPPPVAAPSPAAPPSAPPAVELESEAPPATSSSRSGPRLHPRPAHRRADPATTAAPATPSAPPPELRGNPYR